MAAAVASLAHPHVVAAKEAGLRYFQDTAPGIRRVGSGKAFRYIGPDDSPVRDPETLARIRSLAIPPAWTDVWICPRENGHLQATGRDARGRKQYRYHPQWREARDGTKYERMMGFARALPRIRERVEQDLSLPGFPREKILAAIIRLLEATYMRVGNDEYARTNGSYGITTLQDHHAEIDGHSVRFRFRGKHGKDHDLELTDPRLARIVRHCQDLPGQELFQYLDDDGNVRDVTSGDVNGYLRDVSGEDYTAKDFRTWAGTVLAAMALRELEAYETKAQAKKNLVAAVERVAEALGNTPAVCRKCYVHPAVLDSYLDGTFAELTARRIRRAKNAAGLDERERMVLRLLQTRLERDAGAPSLESRLRGSVSKARRARGRQRTQARPVARRAR